MYIGAVLCAPTSVTEPASDTARCSRQTACNCSETRVRLHLPTPQTLGGVGRASLCLYLRSVCLLQRAVLDADSMTLDAVHELALS